MQVGIPVNQVITLPQGSQLLKLPGSSCDIYAIWLGHLIVDDWTWPNFHDPLDAITVFLDPDTLCIKFTTQIKLPPLCFWYWRNVFNNIYTHVYIIIYIFVCRCIYIIIYIIICICIENNHASSRSIHCDVIFKRFPREIQPTQGNPQKGFMIRRWKSAEADLC